MSLLTNTSADQACSGRVKFTDRKFHPPSPQTSPYDYEKLQFVLEELQRLSGDEDIERGLQLLRFLDKYHRKNPPSEEEKMKWGGPAIIDVEAAVTAETAVTGVEDVS
ncbi:hypothetical protein ElyMa_004882300 [Elysia marginata]|uniref:Uncharacterized protein n=1 Tax=Elysia marginata TaxID=1093978 RepID=A0AAV4ITA8_9GAST|nr:hypothetical protein ElyMa_004882300 [Elysia marginata]